jgi:hypothetical protein
LELKQDPARFVTGKFVKSSGIPEVVGTKNDLSKFISYYFYPLMSYIFLGTFSPTPSAYVLPFV